MTYARLAALLSLLALFSSTIAFKVVRTPHQRGLDARNVPPIPEKIFGTNSGRDAKNKRCCCCCNNCCFNTCCCGCNLCCWLAPSDQFYSSRSTTFNYENISTRSTSAPMISWNGDRNPPTKNASAHVSSRALPIRPPTSPIVSEGTVLPHPTRPPPIGPPPIDPQPVRSSHIDHPSFYPHPTRPPPIGPPPIDPQPTYPPIDPQPNRPPTSFVNSEDSSIPHPTRPPPIGPPPIDLQPIHPPPTYPPIDPQPIHPPPTYPPIDPQPTRSPPIGPPPIGPPPIDPPYIGPAPVGPPAVRPPISTLDYEVPTSFLSSSLFRVNTITEQRNDHFALDRNCNSRELREILVQCIAYNPSESKQRINAAIARKLDGSFGILCADGAVSYLARTVSYLAHTTQFCHLTRHNITCLVFRDSEL